METSEIYTIETNGLTRFFGDLCAVDHINLRVRRGSFYGFLGPNGAGKSTTLRMLTGLLAPTEGSIRVLGLDVTDVEQARELKRRIGVVPETLALYDYLTGYEYLTFVGRIHGLPGEVVSQRCEDLFAMMDLNGERDRLTLEYSHGMKKKLALAAALIANPEVLFLDEPFEGIDAVTSRVIRDLLKRFVHRGGTVFLTSHVLDIVEKLCTDVGIIVQGSLVYQGPIEELRGTETLEEKFLEVVGGQKLHRPQLSWLDA